ncbi:MAG: DMT family transporter [Chloroflexi bacterium]|nr:DMT family transporter [Chloroflexota bacterium]
MILWGELAALAAAVCFSLGPTFFTLAGRRVGAHVTLRWRLLLASLLLAGIHTLVYGRPWPHVTAYQAGLLFAAGFFALALADSLLFPAFVRLGPRLAMLILNLQPVLATALAWVTLKERLALWQLAAIALVLAGVSVVVLEQGNGTRTLQGHVDWTGVGMAVGSALLGAVGVLLAKHGMQGQVPALSANLLRMLGGMVPIWLWAALRRQLRATWAAVRQDRRALQYLLAGVLVGPVLGMSLSLFALRTIPVGIATTLTALPPVLLLPIGRWVFHEHISPRAAIATLAATGGVIWLLVGG